MDQLSIIDKIGSNYVLMELTGALNFHTMQELEEKINTYILDSNIVIDMSLLTQIDTSAMGMLMAAFNDGEDNGTKLFFMNPSENARRTIDKTGFTDVFHIIHSVTEVSDES